MTNHKTKYDEFIWVLRYKLEPNVIYHLSIFWEYKDHTWLPMDEHFICRMTTDDYDEVLINPFDYSEINFKHFFANDKNEIKGYTFLNEKLSCFKHNIAICFYGD